MTTQLLSQGFVYRRGRLRAKDFTLRPGKDTVRRPGQAPGLSTFVTVRMGPKDMVQKIDLALLKPPLRGIADDPSQGGTPGHVAITPVDDTGAVDQQLLNEWASWRGQPSIHPLTQNVVSAVVKTVVSKP